MRRRRGGRQANEQENHQGQSHQEMGWSRASTRAPPRTLRLLQSRRCRPCWLSSSREQVELCRVGGKGRRRRERVLRMMIMMRRTGLLVKTRPTKASSTKTRQHSGAHTLRECTHALRGHKDGGRIQKQANIVSSRRHHRCLKEATLRRCSRGGSSMRTRMKKATNLHTFGN